MDHSTPGLSSRQWKICFIDDEPDICEIYRVGLTAEGFHVVSAEDGSSGLALIRSEHPDAILLDLQMPNTDGFDVLRILRSDSRLSKIPVIVLSNTDNEETFRKVGAFNVAFFFVKSLTDPRKVAGAIREVLTR